MKTIVLHKIYAIAFASIFIVNVLLPSIIYVNFKINQEYIAANLCVEKDFEESTCKGNCQLKKSLAKVEVTKPQKENFKLTVESHITSLFIVSENFLSIFEKAEEKNRFYSIENKIAQGYFTLPFRPPILS